MKTVEAQTGKKFGDPNNPLLVSCRSGAKFSMPGMMDTVLNIGLNDETAEGMVKLTGNQRFVYRRLPPPGADVRNGGVGHSRRSLRGYLDEYKPRRASSPIPRWTLKTGRRSRRSSKRWCASISGFDFPQDPLEQLKLATEAVFRSWNGKRAIDYRNAAGIPDDLGTAVNIVTMVFGNMG